MYHPHHAAHVKRQKLGGALEGGSLGGRFGTISNCFFSTFNRLQQLISTALELSRAKSLVPRLRTRHTNSEPLQPRLRRLRFNQDVTFRDFLVHSASAVQYAIAQCYVRAGFHTGPGYVLKLHIYMGSEQMNYLTEQMPTRTVEIQTARICVCTQCLRLDEIVSQSFCPQEIMVYQH